MAISNYSELKTAIADFLNRDDLTSVVSNFISLAEASIARDLRHYSQEKRATANLNERFEVLPNDFLEMRRLQLDGTDPLRLINMDQMSDLRAKNDDLSGTPKFFCITANNIEFYPTPDTAYTMSMLYYARLDALSDSITTNWLLQRHPDVYLYGALLHTSPYLQEDSRLAVWASLYKSAIDALNYESNKAHSSGSALVMRVK